LSIVERVVNVLPQLHVTLISLYLGWVSIFMAYLPFAEHLEPEARPASGGRRPFGPKGIAHYPRSRCY